MRKNIYKKTLIDHLYNFILRANNSQQSDKYWRDFFNKKLEIYQNNHTTDLDNPSEIQYYSKLFLLIKKHLNITSFKNLKILELGSGTGILSLLMAKEGAEVYLVDSSKTAIRYSGILMRTMKNQGDFSGKVRIIQGDLLKINLPHNYFDIVHNYGVIEHYSDTIIERIISIMKLHAKKNGRIIIAIPNYFSPDTISIWYRYGKSNERYISTSKMVRFLQQVDLSNITCITSTTAFPDFIPINFKNKIQILENFLGIYLHLGFLYVAFGQKSF